MSGKPIDIGHGVTIEFVDTPDGTEGGIIEEHDAEGIESGRCSGLVLWKPVNPGDELWTLLSRDPLTLAPSIECRVCGHHGFIQNGRWVPA